MFYLSEDPAFCSLSGCTGLEFQFEYQHLVLKCMWRGQGGASGSGKMQGEHSIRFYCHLCLVANVFRLYDQVWKMKNVEILVCAIKIGQS